MAAAAQVAGQPEVGPAEYQVGGEQQHHQAGADESTAHDTDGPRPYTAGTWGPSASIALIERDGRTWHESG